MLVKFAFFNLCVRVDWNITTVVSSEPEDSVIEVGNNLHGLSRSRWFCYKLLFYVYMFIPIFSLQFILILYYRFL